MFIVALAFAVVFLCRDVYVLMTPDRRALLGRFAGYSTLILVALTIMNGSGVFGQPVAYAWTRRRFAMAAILIQLGELAIALALRKWARGHHSWIGCILPSPAFLVCLWALSSFLRIASGGLDAFAAMALVTGSWLLLVAVLVLLLNAKEEFTDRKFVDDFALMTSCTALIFVPYGFF
jgi:hypothetical protein